VVDPSAVRHGGAAGDLDADENEWRRHSGESCAADVVEHASGSTVYFIDQFLTAELGPLWMQAVDHELDESGNSQSRAPVRSAEGVY
jgi:hypothetical protein